MKPEISQPTLARYTDSTEVNHSLSKLPVDDSKERSLRALLVVIGVGFVLFVVGVVFQVIRAPQVPRAPYPIPPSVVSPSPTPSLVSMVRAAARERRVPIQYAKRLVSRESSGRPWVVSKHGAIGLTQVKPAVALEFLGETVDLFDPYTNLVTGFGILREHYDREKSWRRALYAYRSGRWRTSTTEQTVKYADYILGVR